MLISLYKSNQFWHLMYVGSELTIDNRLQQFSGLNELIRKSNLLMIYFLICYNISLNSIEYILSRNQKKTHFSNERKAGIIDIAS